MMASGQARTSIPGRVRDAILTGLNSAYLCVRVEPEDYLRHLQRAHQLPILSFSDMYFLPQEILDSIASQTISASMKFAVLEGAGFGIGGLLTVVPDMGILSAIVMRMLQKLSLLYGFEYSTEEEVATLWLAAASAAGLDLGREFVEKEAIERLVPRIIERIAVRISAEVAEKWSCRIIPVVSSALGATLNYYFVREWGRRSKLHFQRRHTRIRSQIQLGRAQDFPLKAN